MKQTENILDFVRRRLAEGKGKWTDFSRDSGVPYFTIAKIAQGKVANPRIKTVQALADYFNRTQAASAVGAESGVSPKASA